MNNDVKAAAETRGYRVLQAGYGAFGRVHARAWRRLFAPAEVTIADPLPCARADNGNYDAVVGMAALIDAIIEAARERRTIAVPRAGKP
jgi:hypothetical protein